MKKIRAIIILYFLAVNMIYCQDQAKNIFGVSAGVVPGIMDIYFDDPYDDWYNRELSPIGQLFYARQVRDGLRIGSYLEFEKANFSYGSITDIGVFNRYNIGINWLGQFPKTRLHLQLGGYAGYGFLKAVDWDNLKGFDLGMITGPAFEGNHLGVALHVQGGHAWYESTGEPEGVMLYTPKLLFKIYYKQ